MSGLVLGSHYSIGPREVYEDRVRTDRIQTAGGLSLAIAMVADGVGGQAKGERASQLAVDTIISYLRATNEADVPSMLEGAVQQANQAVVQAAKQGRVQGMSTTLTLVVVDQDNRLFIANVGDSSAFLVRNGKLTKLTKDHTYANIMVWRGKLSEEEAARHEKSEVVLWALGLREKVQVDLGFYVGTDDFREANLRGRKGLPLRPGDSILVCSDGLVKDSSLTGQPLINEDEIIRTLESVAGDPAAKTLVAFALGREPNDNISAATIQLEPASEGAAATVPEPSRGRRLLGIVPWALAFMLLAVLLLLAYAWWRSNRNLNVLSADATQYVQQQPVAVTDTELPSPIPTETQPPTATLPPATPQPLVLLSDQASRSVAVDEVLTADEQSMALAVNPQAANFAGGGILLLRQGAAANVTDVESDHWRLTLLIGGDAFVQSGTFEQGMQLDLEPSGVSIKVRNGCLGVGPGPDSAKSVIVSCFAGNCSFLPDFVSEPVSLASGISSRLDLETAQVVSEEPISQEAASLVVQQFEAAGVPINPAGSQCLG
ncbi:MAG: PP2C family protein-serine/threonine phosphatase, partial [Anaerolineales bacterium]